MLKSSVCRTHSVTSGTSTVNDGKNKSNNDGDSKSDHRNAVHSITSCTFDVVFEVACTAPT